MYLPLQIINYRERVKKNDDLRAELNTYKTERKHVFTFTPNQIAELASTLNILLPSHEDYFSILTTLEQLSNKTGIRIASYKVGVAPNKTGTIQLTIIGEGTPDSFNAFFNEYRSGGGRFITIDELEFSPRESKISMVLLFYSYEANGTDVSDNKGLNIEMINRLQQIGNQLKTITGNNINSGSSNDLNYQVKGNPFE